MMIKQKLRILWVEWVDCFSEPNNWMKPDALEPEMHFNIYSVGYLVRETKNEIVLCQNISIKTPDISHSIHIPKKMIKARKFLR